MDAINNYPVGAPIPWPQATPPEGYLICDGQLFDKVKYPKLAIAYPSGKLLDLQGMFICGLDLEGKVDKGRTVLSTQNDQIRSHRHDYIIRQHGDSGASNVGDVLKAGSGTTRKTEFFGGNETRPKNMAFLYIVRAA